MSNPMSRAAATSRLPLERLRLDDNKEGRGEGSPEEPNPIAPTMLRSVMP
jgi:hypothetical protein